MSNLYEKLKKTPQAVTPSYLYDYNKAYQDYVYREQIQHDINDAVKRLEQFEVLSKQLKGVFKSIRDEIKQRRDKRGRN